MIPPTIYRRDRFLINPETPTSSRIGVSFFCNFYFDTLHTLFYACLRQRQAAHKRRTKKRTKRFELIFEVEKFPIFLLQKLAQTEKKLPMHAFCTQYKTVCVKRISGIL
jgi:hypothetical protein